uniref:Uncharacterized protein n=1 Tax=Arundo donax TaxID=35708 RepID=A0A0A9A444_ARUDO
MCCVYISCVLSISPCKLRYCNVYVFV